MKLQNHAKKQPYILNIAHRGASAFASENTRGSFLEAIKTDADVIEFDIQRTRDGKFVVIHDDTIDRTSDGSGKVTSLTLQQLKKYNFGVGNNHEKILTLCEALQIIGEKCYVLIEPKSSIKGYEKLLVEEINRAKNKTKVWVHSRHKSILKNIRTYDPSLRLGYVLIFSSFHQILFLYYRWWVKKHNISFFSVSHFLPNDFSTRGFWNGLQKIHIDIYIWTVNDPISIRQVLARGVHGIITNYPGILKTTLKNLKKK